MLSETDGREYEPALEEIPMGIAFGAALAWAYGPCPGIAECPIDEGDLYAPKKCSRTECPHLRRVEQDKKIRDFLDTP